MENNELVKEISRLQDLLAKHGICDDCGELYNHHFDEPLASCGCKQSEWYKFTPHMKQVLELKSERDAVAAQVNLLKDSINKCKIDNVALLRLSPELKQVVAATPQQCLRDVKDEAIQAGLDALGAPVTKFGNKSDDFVAGFNFCAVLLQQHADKVRKGGAE